MTVPHFFAFEEGAGFGGAYIDLVHIALELRRRGVRVTVARSWQDHTWGPLLEAGVEILDHRRSEATARAAGAVRLPRVLKKSLYATELLAQHLPTAVRHSVWGRRHGVTHVFANNSHSHSPAAVATAALMGVPCWSYMQGEINGHNGFRAMLPFVEYGFSVSNFVGEQAVEHGFPPARLQTLYPGVEVPQAELAAPRDNDGTIRVGMVGMFTHWKGQLCFLRGFAKAAAQVPNLEGWLFGRCVPGQEAYEKKIHALIAELGIQDRVRIVSDRSRPEDIYPHVDFTVHASTDPEPFGRVVIEAMSFARPIIAANRGGPGEVVVDGETGYRVAPEDSDEMAKRMIELANDAVRRRAIGQQARADVEHRFTYPRVLAPLLEQMGLQ